MEGPTPFDRAAVALSTAARMSHEAIRTWHEIMGVPVSTPTWVEAPLPQKSHMIGMVMELGRDAERRPEKLHEYWAEQMVASGWKYGDEIDIERRTHLRLVPFNLLPAPVQIEYKIVTAVAGTVLDGMVPHSILESYFSALDEGSDKFMTGTRQ